MPEPKKTKTQKNKKLKSKQKTSRRQLLVAAAPVCHVTRGERYILRILVPGTCTAVCPIHRISRGVATLVLVDSRQTRGLCQDWAFLFFFLA